MWLCRQFDLTTFINSTQHKTHSLQKKFKYIIGNKDTYWQLNTAREIQ